MPFQRPATAAFSTQAEHEILQLRIERDDLQHALSLSQEKVDHLQEKLRRLEGNGRVRLGETSGGGTLDDLLAQNHCLMTQIENLQREAAQSRRERDAAVEEAKQFRDDVKFLTHETETMLMELKEETEEKTRVERELRKAQRELEEL